MAAVEMLMADSPERAQRLTHGDMRFAMRDLGVKLRKSSLPPIGFRLWFLLMDGAYVIPCHFTKGHDGLYLAG